MFFKVARNMHALLHDEKGVRVQCVNRLIEFGLFKFGDTNTEYPKRLVCIGPFALPERQATSEPCHDVAGQIGLFVVCKNQYLYVDILLMYPIHKQRREYHIDYRVNDGLDVE